MNSTIRLIKEVLYRQLLKKRLPLGPGGALTKEKLLSPGFCLLFTLNKEKNTRVSMTCTITQYKGLASATRVLQAYLLLTPALEAYIHSRMTRKVMAFQLYPHLGISHGEVLLL